MNAPLSPRLGDIKMKSAFFSEVRYMDPVAGFALTNLVYHVATLMVWTYSAPTDGGIIDPDDDLHMLAGVSKARWQRVSGSVLKHFERRNGRLYLRHDWIEISDGKRPSLPPQLRLEIGNRDNWTCGYCGSKEGPFDIDHVIPVVRGGALLDPANLLCACAVCNRSKGAKFISEWVGHAG